MALRTQAMILRAVQEGEITLLGGTETIKVDVKVIAAANEDLKKQTEEGRFRGDLYYRIRTYPIHLPPLRERKEDIPLLATYFIRKFAEEQNLGKVPRLSKPALKLLVGYDWPGNIRQLDNAIEYSIIQSEVGEIQPEHLLDEVRMGVKLKTDLEKEERIAEFNRVLRELKKVGIKQCEVAKRIGVSPQHLSAIKKSGEPAGERWLAEIKAKYADKVSG